MVIDHRAFLATLQRKLDEALQPLVAGAPALALLDFPSFSNVGDSAIWLGTLATLRRLGAPAPCYTCDVRTYHAPTLARRLGEGTILLNGGGNLGDLWDTHQHFRERVLADFPNNPIVQLPQSVHFTRSEPLERAQRAFARHPRFTLIVRDHESYTLASQVLEATTIVAPDAAFGLSLRPPRTRPRHDVLWLKREDKEDRWAGVSTDASEPRVDWVDEERTPLIRLHDTVARNYARSLEPSAARGTAPSVLLRALLSASYPRLAQQRLDRGVRLLGRARVVVTDRLHGHILCLLLGQLHVVLDNSYQKLSRFMDTWSDSSPIALVATNPQHAGEIARELARLMAQEAAPT